MAVSGGRSSVRVTDSFPKVTARVDALARDMVLEGARAAARAGASVAARRRRTGLMEEMEVAPAEGTPDGWRSGVSSRAWYVGFQSEGTVASRTRAVKRSTLARRSSATGRARFEKVSGSSGISPLRIFAAMKAAGRKAMLARAERGL